MRGQRTPPKRWHSAEPGIEEHVSSVSGFFIGVSAFLRLPFFLRDALPMLKFVTLKNARAELRDGDLLLFRRRGGYWGRFSLGSLIAIAGRGVHSHAAKLAWWGSEPFVCEVREWYGGRAVTLQSQVQRYPGRIDVYRANSAARWAHYNRPAAVCYLRRLAGCDYGYLSVLRASLLHLPVVRLFARPSNDDSQVELCPPFCSQAVVMAERLAGGVDPVPHLADRLTEPADLAQSPFYEYAFTLK